MFSTFFVYLFPTFIHSVSKIGCSAIDVIFSAGEPVETMGVDKLQDREHLV